MSRVWRNALLWSAANFATSLVVKMSGLSKGDLLLGQFAIASVGLLILWLSGAERHILPQDPKSWILMGARTVDGLGTTACAYEGYSSCFGFAPTVFSLSAIWIPGLGLVFPSLLAGKRRGVVAASAALCVGGMLIGTSNFGASCDVRGIVLALVGSFGGAGVALIQQQLRLRVDPQYDSSTFGQQVGFGPLTSSLIYCVSSTIILGGVKLITGQAIVLSPWVVALGLFYIGVLIWSQKANEEDPVTSGLINLNQLPLSTGAAQLMGESQPIEVWLSSLLVVSGIGLLKAKGNRRQ
jgi:hypothetical protein